MQKRNLRMAIAMGILYFVVFSVVEFLGYRNVEWFEGVEGAVVFGLVYAFFNKVLERRVMHLKKGIKIKIFK